MRLDIVKEFEYIIEYLDTKFVDHFYKTLEDIEVWNELKTMHLRNANFMLTMAKLLQNGEIKTHKDRVEAKETINGAYNAFMGILPDEAFYTTPIRGIENGL